MQLSHAIQASLFALLWLQVSTNAQAQKDSAARQKIYLIGNSLTWDTLPGLLDGDVDWHVDCGKNLKFILENPNHPCVKTSTPWNVALKNQKYDVLCIQPHFGTQIDEDVDAISHWLQMQPDATLVIHTGWNRHKEFFSAYRRDNVGQTMIHSPKYFEELTLRIQKKHPGTEIRSTHAIDSLEEICLDIQQGAAPITSLSELYRDDIHMQTQTGRYLMHNLMRLTLNQPLSDQGFQVDKPVRTYLDGKLESARMRLARKRERR